MKKETRKPTYKTASNRISLTATREIITPSVDVKSTSYKQQATSRISSMTLASHTTTSTIQGSTQLEDKSSNSRKIDISFIY